MTDGIHADVYVLADDRSAQFVKSFLDEFLPQRESACAHWSIPEHSSKPELVIESEDEFLAHCGAHADLSHRTYWNNPQAGSVPRSAHVFYLSEGKLILGLSSDDPSQEQKLLQKMKEFAKSDFGYITYECPPEDTVEEFTKVARATQPQL